MYYVSPAYDGSTSDKQIMERSTMPEDCDHGDSVMADKGFDMQDIFAPYRVTINIPNLTVCQQNHILGTRKLHSRVQVERFNNLTKTYKILLNPVVRNPVIIRYNICVFYVVQFLFMYHTSSCIIHMQVFK